MTTQEFLEKAASISSNPSDRLTPVTKAVLTRNNYVFDAHAHLFDGDCINFGYLLLRTLGGMAGNLRSTIWRIVTNSEAEMDFEDEETLERVMLNPSFNFGLELSDAKLMEMDNRLDLEIQSMRSQETVQLAAIDALIRFKDIIHLLLINNMAGVYRLYERRYAIHNVINEHFNEGEDKELIVVALGMDLNKGWHGHVKKSNFKQNEELGKLAKKYPVLPFLPLDPRRASDLGEDNLYQIFLNGFKNGDPTFFGVKFYPSLGYHPADERLHAIFKVCAEKNIPVVTHCGGEMVSTFDENFFVYADGEQILVNQAKRSHRARFLNEPNNWKSVLEKHPGLKLNLGHFGSGGAWKSENHANHHRIAEILELMKNHQVYSDFSFNLESDKATEGFIHKLESGDDDSKWIAERTMFGTDFWVVLPMSNLQKDQYQFVAKLKNYREAFLKNNVLNFLGLEQYI